MDKYSFYKKNLAERGYKYKYPGGTRPGEYWEKDNKLVVINFEEQQAFLINEKQYLGGREQFKSLCG